MATADLTAARLREVLHYDPETGVFTRHAIARRFRPGPVGIKKRGYLVFHIDGVQYLMHRLAWLYMTGEWPKQVIDHINCNRSDNRFSNLRDVSGKENNRNRAGANVTNTNSGLLGAHFKRPGQWQSRIFSEGRNVYLGSFKTPEDAHAAYAAAKLQMHGIQIAKMCR